MGLICNGKKSGIEGCEFMIGDTGGKVIHSFALGPSHSFHPGIIITKSNDEETSLSAYFMEIA